MVKSKYLWTAVCTQLVMAEQQGRQLVTVQLLHMRDSAAVYSRIILTIFSFILQITLSNKSCIAAFPSSYLNIAIT